MKSLEEVIQNKFLVSKKYNRFYSIPDPIDGTWGGISTFVIDDMECENVVEFVKLVTPFLCYISSLLKYEDEDLYIDKKIIIKLEFHISDGYYYLDILKINDENGIETLKDRIQYFDDIGFYLTFTRRFDAYFFIDNIDNNNNTDSASNSYPIVMIQNINAEKTFKIDECVVCMECKPTVLFCDCGHICICEKCIEIKQFDRCPICKTNITILRIIE